jgi:hypothetical protein
MGNLFSCCCKEQKPLIEFDNNTIICDSTCCMPKKSQETHRLSPRLKPKFISSNSI